MKNKSELMEDRGNDTRGRKRHLAQLFCRSPLSAVLPASENIDAMTDDEIDEYVALNSKRYLFLALLAVLTMFVLPLLLPAPTPVPEPVAVHEEVGSVESVTVHHSTFSEDSTIATDKGVYQVHGAVTASRGAKVEVVRYEPNYGASKHRSKVCIKSLNQTKCYELH